MKRKSMDAMVEWLAGECRDSGDDLDSLEGAVVERLRELGQRTLEKLAEEKKGATKGLGVRADAGGGRGSSATAARRC